MPRSPGRPNGVADAGAHAMAPPPANAIAATGDAASDPSRRPDGIEAVTSPTDGATVDAWVIDTAEIAKHPL